MMKGLRDEWRRFRRAPAGKRFQEHYAAAHSSQHRLSTVARVARIGAALVCVVIGVFLVVLPGPAVVFFAIAGGLIAAESKLVARALDWSELQLRAVLRRALRLWRALPIAGKAAVGTAAAVVGAVLCVAFYRFAFA